MAGISLTADDASNPLTTFADQVSPEDDNKNDGMGISSVNSPDSPEAIHQLSQLSWEQMNPQMADPISDAPENGDVSTSEDFTPAMGGGGGGPVGLSSSGVTDMGDVPNMGSTRFGNPAGGNYITDDAKAGETIVKVARAMLGKPYIWGGEDWSGADCSGLVQLAYKQAGIDMPRLSNYQMNMGKVTDYKDLKPGDLVGWNNSNHVVGADHIAIYIGNNQIIEAPRPGVNIRVAGLYDYDTAEMWAVRVPSKNPIPAQQPKTPKPKKSKATPEPTPASGPSARVAERAAEQKKKKPKKPKSQAEMHSTGSLAARN